MPEAVYGPGKTPEQCVRIVGELLAHGTGPVLLTRASDDQVKAVVAEHGPAPQPAAAACCTGAPTPTRPGRVLVVTRRDGRPPGRRRVRADAARPRLRAGPPRRRRRRRAAPPARPRRPVTAADAVVVLAGMEGALASVIGGLTGAPGRRRADQRRLRRLARGRHRAAGDARLVRQRRHRRRHRQRLRRRLRHRPDARDRDDGARRLRQLPRPASPATCCSARSSTPAPTPTPSPARSPASASTATPSTFERGPARRHRRDVGQRRATPDDHGHDHRTGARRSARCSTPPTCPSRRARPAPPASSPRSPRPRARCTASTADDVELHEVGALDAIVDVVGVAAALAGRSASTRSSPRRSPSGHGTVAAAHGDLPNPPPAVARLLAQRQVPVVGVDDDDGAGDADRRRPARRRSPTRFGAAAGDDRRAPSATAPAPPTRPGGRTSCRCSSARRRRRPHAPARAAPPCSWRPTSTTSPARCWPTRSPRSLAAGAHDAWATPIVMKKGRPAHTVAALVDPADVERLAAVLLAETGSLGVRAADGRALAAAPRRGRRRRRRPPGAGQAGRRPGQGRARRRAAAAAAPSAVPLRDVLRTAETLGHDRPSSSLSFGIGPIGPIPKDRTRDRWGRSRSAISAGGSRAASSCCATSASPSATATGPRSSAPTASASRRCCG